MPIFGSSLPPVVCRRAHFLLHYWSLLAYCGVQHIYIYIVLCFCFVFLRLVYHVLPVFLDYPILIAPSVFSNVYFEVRIDEMYFLFLLHCNLQWNSISPYCVDVADVRQTFYNVKLFTNVTGHTI